MLKVVHPLSVIHLSTDKGMFPFPMPQIISPFSLINISISIGHLSLALLEASSPGFILRLVDICQSDILDDLFGDPR
jgi:hypothetical protein